MRAKQPVFLSRLSRLTLFSPNLIPTLFLRYVLALVLSQGFVLGSHAPFSLGFVAASGSGAEGATALCGALTGYLLTMESSTALRYCAAAILLYALAFALFDSAWYQKQWFMSSCSAIVTALTGFIYLSGAGWNPTSIIAFGSEIVLTALSCLFFQPLQMDSPPTDHGSLLFLIAALLTSAARIHSLLGGTLAALITLLVTRAGAGASALTGGALGLTIGLTANATPLFSAVLCFSGGLTGGAYARKNRLLCVLLFAGCGLLCTAWVHGGSQMAQCIVCAAVLYSILPAPLLHPLDDVLALPPLRPYAHSVLSQPPELMQVRFQLEEQATAYKTLYEHIGESVRRGEPPEDSAVIFDRVSERVCTGCSHFDLCWRRDHRSTCQALTQALAAMLDRGNGQLSDFPAHFRTRCMRLNEFLQASNEELFCYWNRQQYRARLKNNRLAVCRQYAQLSSLLTAAATRLGEETEHDPSGAAAAVRAAKQLGVTAQCALWIDPRGRRSLEVNGRALSPLNTEKGISTLSQALGVRMELLDAFRIRQGQRLVFRQCPPLSATVAVSARQKNSGNTNGDNGIWFRDDSGVLWVVLCDGMGSGQDAADESRLLLTLLKDFLHAGIEPSAALRTLTGALSLRGELNGGFTTVDLLSLDLFSGNTSLYKLGSAPTYYRRSGTVKRITGSALPAGLELDRESVPDVAHFHLTAGDFLLMVTDGITDGDRDDWLRTLLSAYDGESPRSLAQSILASPAAGRNDDRTAVVVRVSNRA